MTKEEAEKIMGERFSNLVTKSQPEVKCPHNVWMHEGFYTPEELEATACLIRIYGAPTFPRCSIC